MDTIDVNAFEDIAASMEAMEKRGKVDLSILEKFDSLAKSLTTSERLWLENKASDPVDAFVLYHAYRSMVSVVGSMRERFLNAPEKRDNPKVVDDARLVLPSLFNVFAIVKPMETQILSPGLRSHILRRVQDMRRVASHAGMLPSIGEGSAVDKSRVNEQMRNLAETLGEFMAREA
jgi:hypothetical protein